MTPSSFLIPYGMDTSGEIVHVDLVPSGKACGLICPSCRGPLVARKGRVRRHHLAHFASTPACEGWLHATAKMILLQRIEDAITVGADLPIRWSHVCPTDEFYSSQETEHAQNMLHKGILNNVATEQHLSEWNIRPDIVCYSADIPKALIEIVDTHRPESDVIHAGLPVLEIHVSGSDDLHSLREGEIPVAKLHNYPCPDPICATCRRRKSEGCHYCQRCGQHVDNSHAYCSECQACKNDWHRHTYCPKCSKVVTEVKFGNVGYGHWGWSHTDMHCEGCDKLLEPETRPCGCPKTYCRPCWWRL